MNKRAAAILLRLAAVVSGFVAACVAATAVLWVAGYAGALMAGLPAKLDVAAARDVFGLVATYTLVPAVVVVALAEWEGWRRWPAYVAVGLSMPLPISILILINGRMSDDMLVFAGQLPLAGALGGLAYWLVAVRAGATA